MSKERMQVTGEPVYAAHPIQYLLNKNNDLSDLGNNTISKAKALHM